MSTLRILGTALILSFGAELAQSARASEPEPLVTPAMRKHLADVPGRQMLMLAVNHPLEVEHIHRQDAYALLYLLEALIVAGVRGGKSSPRSQDRKVSARFWLLNNTVALRPS